VNEKTAPETKALLKELGLHIRATRREAGISRKKLAAALGMSLNNYARIEQGGSNLTVDTLLRVSRGLGANLVVKLELPPAET
jgi:transcriptional regulator with XRE-family HTH domain